MGLGRYLDFHIQLTKLLKHVISDRRCARGACVWNERKPVLTFHSMLSMENFRQITQFTPNIKFILSRLNLILHDGIKMAPNQDRSLQGLHLRFNVSCLEWKQMKIGTWGRITQGHSMRIFVRKMAQRCGVWQIKPMTSPDQDPLSTKSNSSGFGSYSQMKF